MKTLLRFFLVVSKIEILILLILISSTVFPQDRVYNVLLYGKVIPENLLHMQKSSGESSLLRFNITNMCRDIANQHAENYKEGSHSKDSRNIINRVVLGNGFYLVESLFQSWSGNDWSDISKSLYSYDGNGNLIEDLGMVQNGSDWVNMERQLYTYDTNNNMIEVLGQIWENSGWVNLTKTLYTYENSYPVAVIEQVWEASSWVQDWKFLFSYDTSNNLIEVLGQMWNGSDWTDSQRDSYIWDTNNILLEAVMQFFDGSAWANMFDVLYTYDTNNNMIEEFWKAYDGSNWLNAWRALYTYDGNNYLTEELDQNWNADSWEDDLKNSYTYDGNNNPIEELSQKWDGSNWINDKKYLNTYNLLTAVDEEPNSLNSFNLSDNYPNPFNPSTRINYSIPEKSVVSLKVYDILGSEIASLINSEVAAGKHEVNFNAVNLPSGVYLYQLKAVPTGRQAGSFTNTKKMLLIK